MRGLSSGPSSPARARLLEGPSTGRLCRFAGGKVPSWQIGGPGPALLSVGRLSTPEGACSPMEAAGAAGAQRLLSKVGSEYGAVSILSSLQMVMLAGDTG